MSAFIVSPVHIDVLLSVALHGPSERDSDHGSSWTAPHVDELLMYRSGPLTRRECADAGRELLRACEEAIAHRSAAAKMTGVPSPSILLSTQYEFTDLGRCATAVEAGKAILCFEYQASELPNWRSSGVREFCGRFKTALIRVMPGASDAPWEWTPQILDERGLISTREFAGSPLSCWP